MGKVIVQKWVYGRGCNPHFTNKNKGFVVVVVVVVVVFCFVFVLFFCFCFVLFCFVFLVVFLVVFVLVLFCFVFIFIANLFFMLNYLFWKTLSLTRWKSDVWCSYDFYGQKTNYTMFFGFVLTYMTSWWRSHEMWCFLFWLIWIEGSTTYTLIPTQHNKTFIIENLWGCNHLDKLL